ncbi:MAG: type II 3-dehydroquinate dehydratase [Gemmatimonadales bacterium]|nr:type II 3-dehydroquinate dehydratase [Gemmatimonadales bacterium]
MRVTVLNGPNLNLLGQREPAVYGSTTFAELEALVRAEADALGIDLTWYQSNHEGMLVDAIQALPSTADALILNAGAFTHTSLAIRDALLAVQVPFIEVHLSNPLARDAARHHSMTADLSAGLIAGLGPAGYRLALQGLHDRFRGS